MQHGRQPCCRCAHLTVGDGLHEGSFPRAVGPAEAVPAAHLEAEGGIAQQDAAAVRQREVTVTQILPCSTQNVVTYI